MGKMHAMTHFLVSDTKPDGYKLEEILHVLRKDILMRCLRIADYHRTEARHVINNNMKILHLLSDAILLAEDSTRTLDKAFGPNCSLGGGAPRIGEP